MSLVICCDLCGHKIHEASVSDPVGVGNYGSRIEVAQIVTKRPFWRSGKASATYIDVHDECLDRLFKSKLPFGNAAGAGE